MDTQIQIEVAVLIVVLIFGRVFYLIHKITTGFSRKAPKRVCPCKTMICVGSGGHTTEMLNLLSTLDLSKYKPRFYIIANNDNLSTMKILTRDQGDNFQIIPIPRSRVVDQSYVTSVVTTLFSIVYSIPLVLRIRPDLILCNGPGTCIPICFIGFLLKVFFIKDIKVVFVESFCRTKTFSLSGKILMYFADNFLVQWPGLKRKLKRAEYIGQLM